MLYQPRLQKQYSRCTTATIYIPPLPIDTVEGCTLDASSGRVYTCMRCSMRERGDAACGHGDPASERGMGTLRASRRVCVGTLRASGDPVRACVHGPGACVHACMHGDPSGMDWACEDPVGTHMGVRGSSGHAHGPAGIQWARTRVCEGPASMTASSSHVPVIFSM